MKKRKIERKLWNKDFTSITSATALSAIGGEAINFPLSLLVFEETQSTFLAALLLICGMLPDVLLPLFVAPIIDRGSKKSWIVGLDILMAVLYLGIGFYASHHGFNYWIYLLFTLAVGTISVFYQLSYNAWYPDLIPLGFEQKGFAVSNMLYPFITVFMAPISAFLYETIAIEHIFYGVAGLSLLAVFIEVWIKEVRRLPREHYTFAAYKKDMLEGFSYFREEKGIRNIYTYMSITNGAARGMTIMTQAYFQTAPWLSVTMLGVVKTSEMVGKICGGLIQYKWRVQPKKRAIFTKIAYSVYGILDSILLFMPYPFMIINQFCCGVLGSMSTTIRTTAIQSYIPPRMRARVQGLYEVVISLGGICIQLLVGVLGEFMPYHIVAFLLGVGILISMVCFIILPHKHTEPIYASERIRF